MAKCAGIRPRARYRRPIFIVLIGFFVAGIFACWLAYEAQRANSNLHLARDNAHLAKIALVDGDIERAARLASEAESAADRASAATHSLPWEIASAVPWLGSPFEAGQEISDVVRALATDVLSPSIAAGAAISPDQLVDGHGRLRLESLRATAPELRTIAAAAHEVDAQAEAIPNPRYVSAVRTARDELQTQTAEIAKLLDNSATAAELAPSMLGMDGTRSYFIGFQTNAEARGAGGLLGGFGILRVEDGRVRIEDLSKNSELNGEYMPIDLGPEFNALYANNRSTTFAQNSNLSAHFPYAAQIWKSLWKQESGEDVDGAIAIDPVALSYVLGAIGPVTMADGEVVTRDNVVERTESTAYVRFANDNDGRKSYLQDVARSVAVRMTQKLQSPQALLEALGRGLSENRISVWSSDEVVQNLLATTQLGHIVPDDPAPYAGVVINNLGGNKLDYYLTREIEYTAGECNGDTRVSKIVVRLTNHAPPDGLPDYVAGTAIETGLDLPSGTNAASVRLLATTNSTLSRATVDGKGATVFTGNERGHPAFETQVFIPPGGKAVVRFELSEPTASGEPRVPIQPLLDDPTLTVSVPVCPG